MLVDTLVLLAKCHPSGGKKNKLLQTNPQTRTHRKIQHTKLKIQYSGLDCLVISLSWLHTHRKPGFYAATYQNNHDPQPP